MDYQFLKSCLKKSMPVGKSDRYNQCPKCGRVRDAFVVTRVDTGWKFWCHKCFFKGFRGLNGLPPRQVIKKLKAEREHTRVRDVSLPGDFSLDIPHKGRRWLYSYGLDDKDIALFRLGYSEFRDRVILPVYNKGKLVYWQGRNLDKPTNDRPKYVNVRSTRESTWLDLKVDKTKPTIIVEDILSAIKVWKAGYNCISLLGSYVSDELLTTLLKREPVQVIMWLDPDKTKDSVKFQRRLAAFGINSKLLLLPTEDPKDYNLETIREYIGGKQDAVSH